MRFDIITIHPELLSGPFSHSILKRAQEKGLAEVHFHDLRDYTLDKHNRVDDYQFGGGAGMVMTIEPIDRCISALKEQRNYDEVIYMTPDGEQFDQPMANQLSSKQNFILLCGHYKGIDERIRTTYVTREVSIGDYVLSGGELGAAILVDSIGRLIPGALNNESSALTDSFQDGLLAPPVYTRPETWRDQAVPEILRSGNASKIQDWKDEQREKRTQERRPDLLE